MFLPTLPTGNRLETCMHHLSVPRQWRVEMLISIEMKSQVWYWNYLSYYFILVLENTKWTQMCENGFQGIYGQLSPSRSICVSEESKQLSGWVIRALKTLGLNPTRSGTQLMAIWCFIALSLSLSPFHLLDMTSNVEVDIECQITIFEELSTLKSRAWNVIYLLTTDQQTVINYLTNHTQELIFDSNTYKTTKKNCILQVLPTFRHQIKKFCQQFWL